MSASRRASANQTWLSETSAQGVDVEEAVDSRAPARALRRSRGLSYRRTWPQAATERQRAQAFGLTLHELD